MIAILIIFSHVMFCIIIGYIMCWIDDDNIIITQKSKYVEKHKREHIENDLNNTFNKIK